MQHSITSLVHIFNKLLGKVYRAKAGSASGSLGSTKEFWLILNQLTICRRFVTTMMQARFHRQVHP